jgi:nitric oxide reductase NorQ protein
MPGATARQPTAAEMSKSLIDTIAQTVTDGGDAAAARRAMAEAILNQGGAIGDASPKKAAGPAGLVSEDRTYPRPNGQDYHARKLGSHDDVLALRKSREKGLNTFYYGPPGTGKTALVEAAFHDQPGGLFTVLGTNDTEVSDLVGSYVQLPDGRYEWVDGPLVRAAEHGGVLFVDEIGVISPVVLTVLYSVMDGRGELEVTANPQRATVKVHGNFFVVAATNPDAPGVRISEALTSRFAIQTKILTDFVLARQLGVPQKFVGACQNLMKKWDAEECGWAPMMREMLDYRDVEAILGEEVALRNIVSKAPANDRPVVQDVLSRTFARPISELSLD